MSLGLSPCSLSLCAWVACCAVSKPHLYTTRLSRRPARFRAFLYQRPLKLRQYLHHLPHGAACRGCRVYGFRQRPESHLSRFEIIQQGYQVTQRPA